MKSIILFGKGPSVSKCTKEIVNQYDDIAICNYPVLDDFFSNLISNREVKYHFANCNTFDERYNDKINNMLKVKYILNTNYDRDNNNAYKKYIRNKHLIIPSIRPKYEKFFKEEYDLDPNTGILGLQYLIDINEYNKILLVGFDNFKKGEQTYYFDINNINPKLKGLLGNNIKKNGEFNIISGHNPVKTEIYLKSLKDKYSNINIENYNLLY